MLIVIALVDLINIISNTVFLQRSHHVTPPLPSPFSYIFFVCQSFLVIICSVKVYLKFDVTRERARQTCHKGENLIASYKIYDV